MKTFKALFIDNGIIKAGEFPVEPKYFHYCGDKDKMDAHFNQVLKKQYEQALATAKANTVECEDQEEAAKVLAESEISGELFILPSGWDWVVKQRVCLKDCDCKTPCEITKVAKLYRTDGQTMNSNETLRDEDTSIGIALKFAEKFQAHYPKKPIVSMMAELAKDIDNLVASRISELEAENQQLEIKVLDMQDDRSKLREAEHFIDLQKLTLRDLEAENKRLREALIDAKEDAAALIEQHRWIPVTERLPEENIYVLALAKARSIQEPGYNMQVIHSSAIAFGLFSHWQPLPQPPKEQ